MMASNSYLYSHSWFDWSNTMAWNSFDWSNTMAWNSFDWLNTMAWNRFDWFVFERVVH